MSQTVITIENLSKSYILQHKKQERYVALRDVIAEKIKSPFKKKEERIAGGQMDEFWALKDISFEIKRGERYGIVGRNGAGKSTLLKILSRIVEPTSGTITIEGKVSSLLEVGTGFHPELTGRENIFLNGSILGMGKSEIAKKFDEIVAFSEIERFLDTPVKRYSSGMYVRLAFSVAAHLEPEILIVDEVLAVGDSVFQKKCIDKMTSIGNNGQTIIFVSHNLSAVESLCNKGILINKGQIQAQGDIKNVLNAYVEKNNVFSTTIDLSGLNRSQYAHEVIFNSIQFEEMPLVYGKPIKIKLQLKSQSKRTFSDLDFGLNIIDRNQNCIVHCSNRFTHDDFKHSNDNDIYQFTIANNLKPGVYTLILFLRTEDVIQDFLINDVSFEIGDGNPYGFNDSQQIQGSVFPEFKIEKLEG